VLGLAGCLGTGESPSEEDGNGAGTPDGYPGISIETDDNTREDVEFTATVLRGFDDDAPARIRIAFENAGDERQSFPFGYVKPFYGLESKRKGGDEELFLDPGYWRMTPEEPVDGCWKLGDSPHLVNDAAREAELDPGEALTNEYDVYAGPDDCLAAGEYRFEHSGGFYEWALVVTLAY